MHPFRSTVIPLLGLGLLLGTASCGGGGSNSSGGGGGGTPAAPNIYVTDVLLQPAPSTVLQFSSDANGTIFPGGGASPTSTLTAPSNVIFNNGLALDATGDVYVGGQILNGNPVSLDIAGVEILFYSSGASGTATPSRTITSSSTFLAGSLGQIGGLAVDSAGNLYASTNVAQGIGIVVFPPIASGDVTPTRVIAGSATNIGGVNPGQIAVDSADNVYVAGSVPISVTPASILVFNSTATGNVAPINTLGGSNTTITNAVGIALDGAGNIYVANKNGANGSSILEFSAGATGNVVPMRTISGSATGMIDLGNLTVDSAGNIYVLNDLNILKFAPTATGNAAPISSIGGESGTDNIAVH
jgi:hypothetical protein